LRNRYNRMDLFALVPQLGLRFEPRLEQLDRLLDDDELFERVREDLARRYPKTGSRGRPSTPVEINHPPDARGHAPLRLELRVGRILRQRQPGAPPVLPRVPREGPRRHHADPLGHTIGPETIRALNDRVVQLARSLEVARGRKLRVDTRPSRPTSTSPPTAGCSAMACGSRFGTGRDLGRGPAPAGR
jgi:IS5 family transposase